MANEIRQIIYHDNPSVQQSALREETRQLEPVHKDPPKDLNQFIPNCLGGIIGIAILVYGWETGRRIRNNAPPKSKEERQYEDLYGEMYMKKTPQLRAKLFYIGMLAGLPLGYFIEYGTGTASASDKLLIYAVAVIGCGIGGLLMDRSTNRNEYPDLNNRDFNRADRESQHQWDKEHRK